MVTFRGRNRFYVRRDDRTVKMTTDEVRRTVIEVIGIEKTIADYVTTVEKEIVADLLGDDFSLIMHSVPYLLQEDQVDTTSKDLKNALMMHPSLLIEGFSLLSSSDPMPNIHGICGSNNRADALWQTYVHRSGYVGLAYNIEKKLTGGVSNNRKVIYPYMKLIFLAFLNLSKIITEKANMSSPYQVRCSFINAQGVTYISEDQFHLTYTSSITWKRDRIDIPGVRVDHFQDVVQIADLFFERLRNAFGLT